MPRAEIQVLDAGSTDLNQGGRGNVAHSWPKMCLRTCVCAQGTYTAQTNQAHEMSEITGFMARAIGEKVEAGG